MEHGAACAGSHSQGNFPRKLRLRRARKKGNNLDMKPTDAGCRLESGRLSRDGIAVQWLRPGGSQS